MEHPLAVMAALEIEIRRLLEAAQHVQPQEGLPRSWRCTIDGREVVLSIGGIGKVGAAVAASLLCERFRPRTIIFTGVAGGLDPGLQVGDIVVAERTVQHDTGVIENGSLVRYQPGHVPFFNPTELFGYEPSPQTLTRVQQRLFEFEASLVLGRRPDLVWGTILTGDQFINDEETRRHLFDELGGAAVEMEGAAVAQVAHQLGVDHLIIRSLSDLAGSKSTDEFNRFVEEVAANSAGLVRHLLPSL